MLKNKKGLTLIELLAVIAIIAILFVLLIPQINNAINKSRETGVVTDFRDIERAFRTAFMEKEGDIEIADIDKNIEKTFLRLNNGALTEKSPYGTDYRADFIDKNIGYIQTFTKDGKELVMYIYRKDSEILTHIDGFSFSDANDTFVKRDGDYSYITVDGTYSVITQYHGNETNLNIPSSVGGLPLKGIGYHAFGKVTDYGKYSGPKIQSVVFPDSLEWISDGAFYDNEISNLILPNNLKELGVLSFTGNNISSVQLPNGLTRIDRHAFEDNVLTSIIIPQSVNFIGFNAFVGNPDLTTITNLSKIPNEELRQFFNSQINFSN